MSSKQQAVQAAIHIDERYFYDVDLGTQPMITWNSEQSKIEARVVIPYDPQLSYDGKLLKDVSSDQADLPLGEIVVHIPDGVHTPDRISINLPVGPDLPDILKSGKQWTAKWSYAAPKPINSLISMTGQIFDGAEQEELENILRRDPTAFVSNLRLRISLWVPDLFGRAQRDKDRALREMLREQQHERQILIEDVDNITLLAQSLVALANSRRGGHILIYIAPQGKNDTSVDKENEKNKERVESALLRASLCCKPPVPFAAPEFFWNTNDNIDVVRIIIPAGLQDIYRCDGKRYYRKGNTTKVDPISINLPHKKHVAQKPPIGLLEDVFRIGYADDVVFIDAERDVSNVPLGKAICGLINAQQYDGIVVISNLQRSKVLPLVDRFNYGANGIVPQIKARLEEELKRCTPRPIVSGPWLMSMWREQVAVLRIAHASTQVTMYKGNNDQYPRAYVLSHRSIEELPTHDAFTLYLQRLGKGGTNGINSRSVKMVYGELEWPTQPANPSKSLDGCDYDIQRQAMVWQPRDFEKNPGTGGLRCHLDVPMRHALMAIDESGIASNTLDPVLKGMILLRFDDVLASGTSIRAEANKRSGIWFSRMPIHRRTFVSLNMQVRADELFTQRRKMSLIRFCLPDVSLDKDRVADLQEVFSDLGFRLDDIQTDPEEDNVALNGVWIVGMRSKDFCDIAIYTLILCERVELTRQLRYEQRFDSKQTHGAQLDVRIALVGEGEHAAEQIAKLHLQAHALINERLHYLRTE